MEFTLNEVQKITKNKLLNIMEIKEAKSFEDVKNKIFTAANEGKLHVLVGFPEQKVLDYLAAEGFQIRFACGVGYDVWWG